MQTTAIWTADGRVNALVARHKALESEIAIEMKRPLPDPLSLQAMKRKKLRLKDEIEEISGLMRTLSRRREPGGHRAA